MSLSDQQQEFNNLKIQLLQLTNEVITLKQKVEKLEQKNIFGPPTTGTLLFGPPQPPQTMFAPSFGQQPTGFCLGGSLGGPLGGSLGPPGLGPGLGLGPQQQQGPFNFTKQKKCPNNHALLTHTVFNYGDFCDICKYTLKIGDFSESCKGCNYDVCRQCFLTS